MCVAMACLALFVASMRCAVQYTQFGNENRALREELTWRLIGILRFAVSPFSMVFS